MTGVGDMVANLGLDASGYSSGLARAAGEAKRFSSNWTTALQSTGYAIQDFASQIGTRGLSGALGAISNNVGSIGAAFGPTGMLVGGAAMVGISAWQMYEAFSKTKDVTVDIGKNLREARSAVDEMVQHSSKIQDFANDLAKIHRPEDAKGMLAHSRKELAELNDRQTALRVMINGIGDKAGIGDLFTRAMADQGKDRENFLRAQGGLIDGPFDVGDRIEDPLSKIGAEDREKIRGMVGDFQALKGVINEAHNNATRLGQAIKQAGAGAAFADAIKAGVEGGQKAANDLMKRAKAQMDRKDELTRETQTPLEALKDKLARLKQDFRAGIIDETEFDRFGSRMIDKFGERGSKSTKERDAAATLKGSMEDARAIVAANRPSAEDPNKQQLEVMKQQLGAEMEAVRQLRLLQKSKPTFTLFKF